MRKTLATTLTTLLLVGIASGPAAAAMIDSDDPLAPINDLVNGIDYDPGSGSVEVTGPRGTAWTTGTIARVSVGDDIDLRVVDTLATTTTDHDRVGAPKNFARGEASVVSAYIDGVLQDVGGGRASIPERFKGESHRGEHRQRFCAKPSPETCANDVMVQFPVSEYDAGAIPWDSLAHNVEGVLSLLQGIGNELGVGNDDDGNLVVPLPTGTQELVVPTGGLVDGTAVPGGFDTSMTPEGGAAEVYSSVKSLSMLSGLSSLEDAGVGSVDSAVNADEAVAETKAVKIDRMVVLEMGALLRLLGLEPDQLPDETLAAMADDLGIDQERFVDVVGGAGEWNSVAEMEAGIDELQAAATEMLGTGKCDPLDDLTRTRSKQLGLRQPDCLGGLDAIDHFVEAVNQLDGDFRAALVASVSDDALISVTNLNGSVSARASSTGDGSAGAGVWGGIQEISVGADNYNLDSQSVTEEWNQDEETMRGSLNGVISDNLGPAFADVVKVRLMPQIVEQGEIVDREYVQSRAAVALMAVYIDLPALADVEAAARNLAGVASGGSGGGGGGAGFPLGRADVSEPITITVGELAAVARHRTPGKVLDPPEGCADPAGTCPAPKLLTTTWDPENGYGSDGGGSSTNLPRTGGGSSALAILVAGLGTGALTFRRHLGRFGRADSPRTVR